MENISAKLRRKEEDDEDRSEAEFVDNHRSVLVDRVSSVMSIADVFQAATTSQGQMRKLYTALTSGGVKVKAAFYRILQETESYLVQDLEDTFQSPQSSSTQPGQTLSDSPQTERRGEDRALPQSVNTADHSSVVMVPHLSNMIIKGSVNIINMTAPVQAQRTEDTFQSPQSSSTQQAWTTEPHPQVILRVKKKLQDSLKEQYRYLFEGTTEDERTLLNSIYTQLYITEGESEGVNKQHEIMKLHDPSTGKTSSERPINCNDIFKPQDDEEEIRTLMTKGIAGIGKTVSVQKFILDWAEGNANQDIDFIFVLPFRELNLIQNGQFSLHDLLIYFHPELSEIEAHMFTSCKVLFIFDGLDESTLPLNISGNRKLVDLTNISSVDRLLTNLIEGNLLPSALLWITSRPAAANQIDCRHINKMAEVRGFTEAQIEEYFRKRFRNDEDLADRILSHIKATRSLYIMCYIPIMCRIISKVLEYMFRGNETEEIPASLTGMYIHFLIVQTGRTDVKYHGKKEKDPQKILESNEDFLLTLAKLAFQQLEKGQLIFNEKDLVKCGIDVNNEAVKSGLCTEFLKKVNGFYEVEVYCFVHLSFQEFLAALYVFYCCVTKNISALESFLQNVSTEQSVHELLKRVVDKALQSKNGHLDLFLRFLLVISLESNQTLLQGLLPQTENSSETVEEMKKYLRKPDVENISPERHINLFLCLTEMKDSSVHEDIHKFLLSPDRDEDALSEDHFSALANAVLMSEGVLDEMDLSKYNISKYRRNRLFPAVRKCRKAVLTKVKLSHENCVSLASSRQSPDCPPRELELRKIRMHEDGDLRVVFAALGGTHCKLETLRLADMKLNYKECVSLASSLQSPDCPLRVLELRGINAADDDDDDLRGQ